MKASQRRYSEAHPRRRQESKRKYLESGGYEKGRIYAKRRYYADHERSRQRMREHGRKLQANGWFRVWRQANPDKCRAIRRRYRQKHPEFAHKYRAERRLRVGINVISPKQWDEVVAFYSGLCAYCGVAQWQHQDHVVPLVRGGAHAISNVVPACAKCNQTKHADIWIVMRPHPFLEQSHE